MQRKTEMVAKTQSSELAPLETIDGPRMLALPTDRHRDFVRGLYQVKPGHGSASKAARLAGWGTEYSTAQSIASIASRLMHDERVLDAIHEMDQKMIRGVAPRAIGALSRLVEDPKHRDHARGIAMVLDRVHPAETQHTMKVQHDVTPGLKETAEVMERIAALAQKFGVSLPAPVIIDNEPSHADR